MKVNNEEKAKPLWAYRCKMDDKRLVESEEFEAWLRLWAIVNNNVNLLLSLLVKNMGKSVHIRQIYDVMKSGGSVINPSLVLFTIHS